MQLKSYLVIVLFILSMNKLHAAPVVTPAAVPSMLHVYDAHGNTYVDLVAHGCSGKRYRLNPSHVKYDAVVSVLLSAQVAKKKVVIRYDGCNGVPQGNVIGVYLVD